MTHSDGKANILFVDDEPRVLSSMRALFRRDYNVHTADSGAAALALLETTDVDVIVSDQRMPGMTGVDVLKACKARAPRAMRILLTGYADRDAIEASINEGEVFRYLTKPCARDTLKETVALAVRAAGVVPAVLKPEPVTKPATPAPPVAERSDTEPSDTRSSDAESSNAQPAGPQRPSRLWPLAAPRRRNATIELLVLSQDRCFTAALESALGMSYRTHAVSSIDQAIGVLEQHPIGVLITDMAVHGDEVASLTAQLKHQVPQLVTIVASEHSDAHRLIELINSGQVFRFLLKPIKPAQTAIWIDSAVTKHLELVRHPELVVRHAVAPPATLRRLGEGLLRNIAERLLRLRDRPEPSTAGGSRTP
jgi:DNA-binding NtrC family response regulator